MTIDITKSLPEVVADTDKIREVMINLIGNSLKFTPKDGTVAIRFENNGDQIITHISDTGAGMTEDMFKDLFQKFGLIKGSYQVNKASTTQGTGLGLYMAKMIIE